MSTIPKPGRTPKTQAPLFHLGTNHTDKYGDIEVDHADVIRVMDTHRRRGRQLAIDVEHATYKPHGKPADWQNSHGWVDLRFDGTTIHGVIDYNKNGSDKLAAREVAYDSPVISTWRGNHLSSIEMLSLVKDPARNHSIPLCMSNDTAATAEQTPDVKNLQRLHSAAGEFISALTAAQGVQSLRGVSDEAAAALVSPVAKINELLQQSGAAVAAKEAKPADTSAAEVAPAGEPQKLMSGQADSLSVLGAEVMAKLGVKSPDEALGKLQALQDNTQTLMSAQRDEGKAETKLLLLSGLQAGKIFPDEVEKYKDASPIYVQTLMSNRLPGVNVRQAQPAAVDTVTPSSDTDHVATKVTSMIERIAGVKL